MRIIIVGPAFPLRGGIADFNEALALGLQNENIDTKLFSFYFQYPKILFPGKSQKSDGQPTPGLSIVHSISSLNPFSWSKTAKLIAKENPDLVIIRYWLPFMAPALGTIAKLLRRKKIKVIAITDNVFPHEKRIGDKILTNYFIKNCDGFVAMSKSVLEDLSSFTATTNKKFLPHPIYDIFGKSVDKTIARTYLGLLPTDKIILFFGFIRSYKGLDLLIEAMGNLQVRKLNVKLIIAGEFYENEIPYLDKINAIEGGKPFILKTNFIGKEDVKYYFGACDLVVQPYKNATQSGITQIAYHFGKPMLVTNVGGLAEIVANGKVGYVVERSSDDIAEAIIDFYQNDREVEFSKNVLIDSRKFSWKNFIDGILELKNEIHSR